MHMVLRHVLHHHISCDTLSDGHSLHFIFGGTTAVGMLLLVNEPVESVLVSNDINGSLSFIIVVVLLLATGPKIVVGPLCNRKRTIRLSAGPRCMTIYF